jgi:hypothetical protein
MVYGDAVGGLVVIEPVSVKKIRYLVNNIESARMEEVDPKLQFTKETTKD